MSIGGRASNRGVSFESDDRVAKFVMQKDNTYKIIVGKRADTGKIRKFVKKIPLVKGLFSLLTGGRVVVAIIILIIINDFMNYSACAGNSEAHLPLLIITGAGAAVCLLYIFMTIILKAKETRMYHGAEHKTIYAYENGMELTLSNVRACPRVARRCGTNFGVFFVLFCFAFNFLFKYDSLTLISAYVLAYELFDLKNGERLPIVKWFFRFGGFCQQNLFTAEPTDGQILATIDTLKKLVPAGEK